MANYNSVILAGNLTRDVELRFTPKGAAVAKIGLAINRSWTQDGEKREEVCFVDVEAWAKTAEIAAQHLKKGSSILVDGRLRMEVWTDKQTNQSRSKLVVVAETIQFLDRKPQGESQPRQEASEAQNAPATPAEDDVPF